jgi:uncharacterized phiE125 gp8 family phage protein
MGSLVRLSPPGPAIITIAECKSQVRFFEGDEDALLAAYLRGAQEWLEAQIGGPMIEAQYQLATDHLPGGAYDWLEIPLAPLRGVNQATYLDTAGTMQVLAPTVYRVVGVGSYGRIVLGLNQTWPPVARQSHAVLVTFTAGYGPTHNDVPEPLRAAALLLVGHLFQNRSATAAGPDYGPVSTVPFGVDALIAPYRNLRAEAA